MACSNRARCTRGCTLRPTPRVSRPEGAPVNDDPRFRFNGTRVPAPAAAPRERCDGCSDAAGAARASTSKSEAPTRSGPADASEMTEPPVLLGVPCMNPLVMDGVASSARFAARDMPPWRRTAGGPVREGLPRAGPEFGLAPAPTATATSERRSGPTMPVPSSGCGDRFANGVRTGDPDGFARSAQSTEEAVAAAAAPRASSAASLAPRRTVQTRMVVSSEQDASLPTSPTLHATPQLSSSWPLRVCVGSGPQPTSHTLNKPRREPAKMWRPSGLNAPRT